LLSAIVIAMKTVCAGDDALSGIRAWKETAPCQGGTPDRRLWQAAGIRAWLETATRQKGREGGEKGSVV
jgi:hypothetical protein